MAFVKTWGEAIPDGSEARSLGDDRIRELKYAIRERLAIDHEAYADEAGHSYVGYHTVVHFTQQSSPTKLADIGQLYCKDVTGTTELFYTDEAGNEKQLTTAGKLNIAATEAVLLTGDQTVAGVKSFSSTPLMDAIDEKTPTAGVTIDGCLIKDGQVADSDTVDGIQATSTDLKPLGTWTAKILSTVYQATTDGFAVAFYYAIGIGNLQGYTDSANPPTTMVACDLNSDETRGDCSIMFPVKKSDYWKVVGTSGTVYWIPLGV